MTMQSGRYSALFTLAMLLLLVLAAWPVEAAISGTNHDFSGYGWNPSGEICIVCHTPHNSDTNVTVAPLWNHQVSTATFQPYNSATLNAPVGQPSGISLLCLSCHDGTVAVDSFGGNTSGTQFMSGHKTMGTNLRDDHPISFLYDAALVSADGGLNDPATIAPLVLFNGRMECGTCHDVHNSASLPNFFRMTTAGSALCLKCHSK